MASTGSGWLGCLQHLDVHCLRCGLTSSSQPHSADADRLAYLPEVATGHTDDIRELWPETVGFLPGLGSPELLELQDEPEEPDSFREVARLARLLRCLGPVTMPPAGTVRPKRSRPTRR